MKFKAVFALPLIVSQQDIEHSIEGWPQSWLEAGYGLTRQMRWLGNREYKKTKVSHIAFADKPLRVSDSVEISSIVMLRKPKTYALIVVFVNHRGAVTSLNQLTRPGLKSTQELFQHHFSLTLDPTETVRATCIYEASGKESQPVDGALMVSRSGNGFVFDITYGLLVAAIGTERQILEKATKIAFGADVFAHRARKALGLLENWLSVPSSDSTYLLDLSEQLRKSIRLDERKNQVQRSLAHRVRAVNYGIAAFAASLTIGATSLSLFIARDAQPIFGTVEGIAIVFILSIVVGFVSWIVTRRA